MEKKQAKEKEKGVDYFTSLFPKPGKERDERQLYWGASTASALIGVQHPKEVIGALLVHGVGWWYEGRGPSVVYNFLSGIRLQRGQWQYAVIPLATDLNDIDMGDDTNIAHVAALAVGYFASANKLVG